MVLLGSENAQFRFRIPQSKYLYPPAMSLPKLIMTLWIWLLLNLASLLTAEPLYRSTTSSWKPSSDPQALIVNGKLGSRILNKFYPKVEAEARSSGSKSSSVYQYTTQTPASFTSGFLHVVDRGDTTQRRRDDIAFPKTNPQKEFYNVNFRKNYYHRDSYQNDPNRRDSYQNDPNRRDSYHTYSYNRDNQYYNSQGYNNNYKYNYQDYGYQKDPKPFYQGGGYPGPGYSGYGGAGYRPDYHGQWNRPSNYQGWGYSTGGYPYGGNYHGYNNPVKNHNIGLSYGNEYGWVSANLSPGQGYQVNYGVNPHLCYGLGLPTCVGQFEKRKPFLDHTSSPLEKSSNRNSR